MIPSPAPATSHAASGFPALRAPALFVSRVMRRIRPQQLSVGARGNRQTDRVHRKSTAGPTCRWRIPKITRRWAFDRVRDSAVATGMKQSLMAAVLQQAREAVLPNLSACDVDRNSPGRLGVSPPDRLPSRITFGPGAPAGLSQSIAPRTDATVEHKARF